ncbi:hypothetical protein A2U01_0089327, partial [Trifolium medium]|nr:hypothetical protein [Trifolium medium]
MWLDSSLLSASSGARFFKLCNTSAGRQILGGGFETEAPSSSCESPILV